MRKESQVTKLINIYLDGLVSVGNDAGYAIGDSMLAKMIQFCGQPPRGTGMDQSNLSMLNAVKGYQAKHHDFPLINGVVTRLVAKREKRRHILALLVKNYYHGINDRTDRVFSEEDKIALWLEHCNRAPWNDRELMDLTLDDARVKYRYGVKSGGPRLVRREAIILGKTLDKHTVVL